MLHQSKNIHDCPSPIISVPKCFLVSNRFNKSSSGCLEQCPSKANACISKRLITLLEKMSMTVASRWIVRNFTKELFYRKPEKNCCPRELCRQSISLGNIQYHSNILTKEASRFFLAFFMIHVSLPHKRRDFSVILKDKFSRNCQS